MDTLELRRSKAERFRSVVFYLTVVLTAARRRASGYGGLAVRPASEGGERFAGKIDPVEN